VSFFDKSKGQKTALKLIFCIIITFQVIPFAYAQSIPITIGGTMEQVIFDGEWSFWEEWKHSSLDEIPTESGIIYLRSAHQGDFVYFLVDVVPDQTIDNNQDWGVVCFDTKSDKNAKPDENDYCFMIKLGSDKVVTLQGTELEGFKVVKNHFDLIGVGGTSIDRYSQVPHAAYEFKIPIELLERTDHYGFYIGIFDFTKSVTYTWPTEIDLENSDIPSTDKWGVLYSPDKSLPEYELPLFVLILGSMFAIFLSSKSKRLNLFYLNR